MIIFIINIYIYSGKKNELIIFDESNGTPDGIQLVGMEMGSA